RVDATGRCSISRRSASRAARPTKRERRMTSSPDRAADDQVPAPPDAMPPALSSMWRLCRLGYRHEPRLMLAAFVLSQPAAVPDALLALWLMLLGKGVISGDDVLVRWSAIGLGVSSAASW